MKTIPVFQPLLQDEEINASREALEMGWLGMGSYVGQFEAKLGEFLELENRYVAAVSTGHAALHLSLLLAGVGPGDEVITPAFNNVADFQAIHATGADIVFCDIDETTLCIDLAKAESLVTDRTKVIIVMDYDCILCDHDAVADFAARHQVRVIHDAAHSFGSRYKGRKVGSFSDISMFSFDPVKTMTCIDGGAVIVSSEEELQMVREMRLIGMGQRSEMMYQNARAWTYDVQRLGFRYHMANLHAAIGLAQLGKINIIAASRHDLCLYYTDELSQVPGIILPQSDFADVTPFMYYIRVQDGKRDALQKHMREQGVETGIHWQPGHWFTLFKNCKQGDLSVTNQVADEIMTLPFHSLMPQETRQRVVDSIRSFFGG